MGAAGAARTCSGAPDRPSGRCRSSVGWVPTNTRGSRPGGAPEPTDDDARANAAEAPARFDRAAWSGARGWRDRRIPSVDLPVLAGFGADGSPSTRVAERAPGRGSPGASSACPPRPSTAWPPTPRTPGPWAGCTAAKGRPADHPLIVHVAGAEALDGWSAAQRRGGAQAGRDVLAGAADPDRAAQRAGRGLHHRGPGRRSPCAARTIPWPWPASPALVTESGDPARGVAAPSANRFGRVSPTRAGGRRSPSSATASIPPGTWSWTAGPARSGWSPRSSTARPTRPGCCGSGRSARPRSMSRWRAGRRTRVATGMEPGERWFR